MAYDLFLKLASGARPALRFSMRAPEQIYDRFLHMEYPKRP